ncbi:MAG: amidohydrolase family protein [Opitutae bacterium]|nr:amidohydrolase family protein [Opitutae bacterium]
MIDAHTHCFPPEISDNVSQWAKDNKEPHWLELVAPKNKPSLQGWASKESMVQTMDDSDINQSILLGWYWENKTTCLKHNLLMKEWMDFAPKRLHGFASIYPNDDPINQLELANSMGFKGVGELHPVVQDYATNKAQWHAMAQWCEAHNWPINFHVSEGLNVKYPNFIPTPFNIYLEIAIAYPNLKIILSHWGGGIPFFELNHKIKNHLKNVYYDTAASPLLYDINVFRNVINLVGSEKILFGSDFPLKVYPKKQKIPEMQSFIKDTRLNAGLSKKESDQIFEKNISELLSL